MVEHARGDPKYDEMMSYMKQKVCFVRERNLLSL